MDEYVYTLVRVVTQMQHTTWKPNQQQRMRCIAMMISNYVCAVMAEQKLNVEVVLMRAHQDHAAGRPLQLTSVFEYIACHQIILYDFSTIQMEDVDLKSKGDIERFVLSHVYYLTQSQHKRT
jgi:hypothetical protein